MADMINWAVINQVGGNQPVNIQYAPSDYAAQYDHVHFHKVSV